MSQLKVDSIVPRGGLPSGSSGGIIQTKTAIKTDTSSYSVGSGGTSSSIVSVSITPQSSSSKILIHATLSGSKSDQGMFLKLFRGSTQIIRGDASGSCQRVSTHLLTDQSFIMSSTTCVALDSPSTTSSTTYSIRAGHGNPSTQTIYVNRDQGGNNGAQIGRGVTIITVQEVTA
tara:strand:- start:246 stop:767 length:522 start_codon:yes stop_codon:yes gene_type:complete